MQNSQKLIMFLPCINMFEIFYHIKSISEPGVTQDEWNINVTRKLFEVQPIIKRSFTPMERRRDDVAGPELAMPISQMAIY